MLLNKKNLLFILILYSLYVAITTGESWDERYHYNQGKIVFDYLYSYGRINQDLYYREFYSASYWVIQYFISLIFSPTFSVEIMHLINLGFASTALFGIKKLSKILFNERVGNIAFILLFFFPIFFGHMSINTKDTVLATCHIWSSYYLIKYMIKKNKTFNIFFKISVFTAVGTGIQLVYIGSLLPIIFFFILDVFFIKKLIKNKIFFKDFILKILKSFLVFYLILIFFWIDAHQNIFIEPFLIFNNLFGEDYYTGWPYNVINGYYFESTAPPVNYFFLYLFYKTPEFLLICYFLFLALFIFKNNSISKLFIAFNYKIIFIIIIIIYPAIVINIITFPIYDGVRLLLWGVPYLTIIPAILIDYLLLNSKKNIILIYALLILFFYFLYNFVAYTPYNYSYVNSFIQNKNKITNGFENDYWGITLNELIKKFNIHKNSNLLISTCGVNRYLVEEYLKKNNFSNFLFKDYENSEFIIMTNRAIKPHKNKKITTCYQYFKGTDVSIVKRNGIILSTIRKK